MALIAFDLDGVILDCANVLRESILGKYGVDIHPIQQYGLKVSGIKHEELMKLIRDTLQRTTIDLLPYNDTLECLNRIYDKTKTPIQIVTARNHSLSGVTFAWCNKHFDFPYYLDFVSEFAKREFLLMGGYKYWADDNVDVLNHVCEYNIKGFLFNKTYNMNREISDRGVRVDTMTGVCEIMGF